MYRTRDDGGDIVAAIEMIRSTGGEKDQQIDNVRGRTPL